MNAGSPREPRSRTGRPHRPARVDERAARPPRRPEAGRGRAIGALLLVLGAVFLVLRLAPLDAAGPLWPLALIVPGALMVLLAAVPGRALGTLAVPGALLATLGLVLGLQAVTGRYDTWAYAWGLIPAAVGVGRWLQGAIEHAPEQRSEGVRLAAIGAALFVGFGLYFEVIVFGGMADSWPVRVVGPVLLIVAGLALLFLGARRSRRGPPPREEKRPGSA